ncbi:MAG: AI-2E family transporter [Candidatus Limiplasma sp.]|nr:AI-2E family transporter [Candidatus Limiplasma sp.]MEA5144485.1 AI-2E family transporter [Candidatus Limiplasma sp.]
MNQPVRYATERIALRLLAAVAAVLIFRFALPFVWDALSPFIIAIPIAAALQPLIRVFERRLHMNRGAAVAFWVVLFAAAMLALVYWFVSFAVGQIVTVASNAPTLVNGAIGVLREASDRILDAAEKLSGTVSDSLRDSLNTGFKWLGEQGTALAGATLNLLLGFASSLPYALVYANFLILGVYFITRRYPALHDRIFPPKPEAAAEDSITMLRRSAVRGVIGYVRVQVLWFILLMVLSTVFFQFMGFQYAALIGVVAALLEMIPQFGCGVFFIPWAAVCFIIQDSHSGWVIVAFYSVYSMMRRLIDPKLLGVNLGMSPLLSLVGMFVGMRLGGVLGLILGPIAMVVLVSAVHARIFDGLAHDVALLVRYMKVRWRLGRDTDPVNVEK